MGSDGDCDGDCDVTIVIVMEIVMAIVMVDHHHNNVMVIVIGFVMPWSSPKSESNNCDGCHHNTKLQRKCDGGSSQFLYLQIVMPGIVMVRNVT